MKLAELTGQKAPKIIIFGEVGSGKTVLVETLGERGLLLDLDEGALSGLSTKDDWTEERKKIEVRSFKENSPHKSATAFLAIKTSIFEISNDIHRGTFPHAALALDSLSALSDAALAYVMGNSGKLNQTPEIQHWGIAFNEIKNIMTVLRSLPIPVVMTAHEQVKTFGKGLEQEDKLEIAIPGKNLARQICRYFDEILYLRAKPIGGGKRQYVLQTFNNGVIPVRSRASLPDMLDTKIGMWEIIKLMGYVPPHKEKPK